MTKVVGIFNNRVPTGSGGQNISLHLRGVGGTLLLKNSKESILYLMLGLLADSGWFLGGALFPMWSNSDETNF